MRDVAIRAVLDVDTGIDDALALLYAVAHPELDLAAVTCVSGNVALQQVVSNTCSVLDLGGARAVPVGSGADATLLGQGPRIDHRHGANGLGDLPIQASNRDPQPDNAVELLRDRLRHTERPVTLLALAPLTNLAMLVRNHLEEIAGSIEKLIFVGGRLAEVDPPEPAEFNVGHDPEATATVVGAGLPITMYGLDVFTQVTVSETGTARLAQSDRPAVRFSGELLRVRHGRLIGHAGALIMLTNPELFTVQRAAIRIGLRGAERGRTLIDPAAPSIDVVTDLAAAQAAQRFVDVILDWE
jgi:pyrimidine-specific ribonucleoside hydrolase